MNLFSSRNSMKRHRSFHGAFAILRIELSQRKILMVLNFILFKKFDIIVMLRDNTKIQNIFRITI